MAKHTTKATGAELKVRPAPYAKSTDTSAKNSKGKGKGKPTPASTGPTTKARVEVRYEGAGSSTGAAFAKKVHAPVAGIVEVKAEPTEATISQAPSTSTHPAAASSSKPASTAKPPTTVTQDSFVVIAGSYEKLLYGIEGTYPLPDPTVSVERTRRQGEGEGQGPETPAIQPVFIFPAHLAYVKCIAASPGGKWLATGSEDEFIKVWDLRRRKEVGSLSQHSGMFAVFLSIFARLVACWARNKSNSWRMTA